jgi:hypothetical protein
MNGWIRLATVLTFVWAIAVFFYVRHIDTDRASDWSGMVFSSCSSAKAVVKEYANRDCIAEAHDTSSKMDPGPGNAAFAALAPIPFIWLIGWLIFLVIRWVVRGFKQAA